MGRVSDGRCQPAPEVSDKHRHFSRWLPVTLLSALHPGQVLVSISPWVMYFLQTTGFSWVNYICPLLKLVRISHAHSLFPGYTGGIGQDVPIPKENGIKSWPTSEEGSLD